MRRQIQKRFQEGVIPHLLGLISRHYPWQLFSVAAANLVVISRWGEFALWEKTARGASLGNVLCCRWWLNSLTAQAAVPVGKV